MFDHKFNQEGLSHQIRVPNQCLYHLDLGFILRESGLHAVDLVGLAFFSVVFDDFARVNEFLVELFDYRFAVVSAAESRHECLIQGLEPHGSVH